MSQQVDFSKCRHFDTPRCPNQNLEIMLDAAKALTVLDYNGENIQYMNTLDLVSLNKICAGCDKYKRR